jgi:hypothetical protein
MLVYRRAVVCPGDEERWCMYKREGRGVREDNDDGVGGGD